MFNWTWVSNDCYRYIYLKKPRELLTMSIHKDIKRLYKKHYNREMNSLDTEFLGEVSSIICSLEQTLRKFINGSNKIE